MIERIVVGDITDPTNKRNIIIGMNATLEEASYIGLPHVQQLQKSLMHPLALGSVLSFRFDRVRKLHMLICHNIGIGGWASADKYVRFGLDYLNHTEGETEKFSVVQIGTGPIGIRDGADSVAIRTSMATSFLRVTLFVRDYSVPPIPDEKAPLELVAYAAWSPKWGRRELALDIAA
jgi:hypothetical protein